MKYFTKFSSVPFLTAAVWLGGGMAYAAPSVHMSRNPGSSLEKAAIALNMDLIKDSQAHGEKPVVFTDSVHLGGPKDPAALFVQIQSGRLCGAAGCATSVYVKDSKGQWKTVLDAVNGTISVLPDRHKGMLDILVDKHDRWIWNGDHYVDTQSPEDAQAPG